MPIMVCDSCQKDRPDLFTKNKRLNAVRRKFCAVCGEYKVRLRVYLLNPSSLTKEPRSSTPSSGGLNPSGGAK